MSGRVRLDPRAAVEVEEAAEWYEHQRAGLGRDLVLDVRRVRVRRFPYQVVYVTLDDDIVVIAVAHDRRRPGYWASRKPST